LRRGEERVQRDIQDKAERERRRRRAAQSARRARAEARLLVRQAADGRQHAVGVAAQEDHVLGVPRDAGDPGAGDVLNGVPFVFRVIEGRVRLWRR
jgi:hypothetical protein